MNNFSIAFQINTGSFTKCHYTEQELIENIQRLFGFIKADKVILGWFPDSQMYHKAVKLIHSYNAEAYLWLPVFADVMPSLGLHGKSNVTHTASNDEQFEFIPPEVGTNHVFAEYETVAKDAPFDGVFLDRIRYGIPAEDFSRMDKITNAAKELVQKFHARNLKVGLDLFAPHLAPYMGQDSETLGKTADFIKPMMYWATDAPAGIPYEEKVFRNILKKNLEYKDKQLEDLASDCVVLPGIEVNNKPGICSTTPEYAVEKIKYFMDSKCQGAVLSWNCPDASNEMLKAIGIII